MRQAQKHKNVQNMRSPGMKLGAQSFKEDLLSWFSMLIIKFLGSTEIDLYASVIQKHKLFSIQPLSVLELLPGFVDYILPKSVLLHN